LLKKRKTLTEPTVNLNVAANGVPLRDACKRADKDLIEFLTECTLSKLEHIYNVHDKRYSDARNNVIHSNLFLSQQLGSDHPSRDKQNRGYLKDAKKHLIEASEKYFRQKIIESNGLLRFKR
jgi:hypothetical protein